MNIWVNLINNCENVVTEKNCLYIQFFTNCLDCTNCLDIQFFILDPTARLAGLMTKSLENSELIQKTQNILTLLLKPTMVRCWCVKGLLSPVYCPGISTSPSYPSTSQGLKLANSVRFLIFSTMSSLFCLLDTWACNCSSFFSKSSFGNFFFLNWSVTNKSSGLIIPFTNTCAGVYKLVKQKCR